MTENSGEETQALVNPGFTESKPLGQPHWADGNAPALDSPPPPPFFMNWKEDPGDGGSDFLSLEGVQSRPAWKCGFCLFCFAVLEIKPGTPHSVLDRHTTVEPHPSSRPYFEGSLKC